MVKTVFDMVLKNAAPRRVFAALMILGCATAASAQTIRVSPANEELEARIEAEALVLQAAPDATRAEVLASADGDYSRLLAVLYEEGYFGPSISITVAGQEVSTITPLNVPTTLSPVVISVTLGPEYSFGQAEIAPRAPGSEPPEGFVPGATAGTAIIGTAANGALADWRRASHAKAEITGQQITARHSDNQIDVAIAIEPGPPLTFGRLTVEDHPDFRRERILQIIGFPSGDDYSPKAVRDARNRLVDTGAFSSVVLEEAEEISPGQTLDFTLGYEPAPKRRIGFGGEIDTTEGLSLQAFWLHRNIFRGAESLRFDASVDGIGGPGGGIDYTLGTTLRIPGFRRADDTLEFTVGIQRENFENVVEDLAGAIVRRSRQVNDDLEVGVFGGLRFSEATDDDGTTRFKHIILGIDGELDLRDDPLNSRGGTYSFVEIQPFIGVDDSESGIRITGDFRAYQSVGDAFVLALRGQLGSVIGPEIDETPPDFLFLSGGGGTVRGQGFESLGVGTGDDLTGGLGFAGLSLELRRDISDTISVVGFADYGYVSQDSELSNGEGHAGAGVGVRYNTPFGPFRVDVGVPVGDSSDGTEFGLYIGLGQSF
ncbi:MAG: BamA/TamA family outer membrane protein [Pseudomonadota bacterium]